MRAGSTKYSTPMTRSFVSVISRSTRVSYETLIPTRCTLALSGS